MQELIFKNWNCLNMKESSCWLKLRVPELWLLRKKLLIWAKNIFRNLMLWRIFRLIKYGLELLKNFIMRVIFIELRIYLRNLWSMRSCLMKKKLWEIFFYNYALLLILKENILRVLIFRKKHINSSKK